MGPRIKWQKITGRSTCSRRATRELRDVLRERLRRELDALRERQVRMEGGADLVDREPKLRREGRLGDHLPGFGCEDVRADEFLAGAAANAGCLTRVATQRAGDARAPGDSDG